VAEYAFDELKTADLVLEAIYRGGSVGNVSDDPLARLLPVGNQGGFRYKKLAGSGITLVVLYTSGVDRDWPDVLDVHTGRFTYFGDNKTAGRELHDTQRGGNLILREAFMGAHEKRFDVPPFFIFEKGVRGRDVVFRGLAIPGGPELSEDEDLVAVWRTSGGTRFQNYRALFTVLDVATITRPWIEELLGGQRGGHHAPDAWRIWRETGRIVSLGAPPTVEFRTKAEQLPEDVDGIGVLDAIHGHFAASPHLFEQCAADLWQMIEPGVTEVQVTRPVVDGGRDAIGRHRLGPVGDRITVDFALEAKCNHRDNAVGVKGLSRLISRLLHRQYGVLVTTSYLGSQPYRELREDGHPVVVVSGIDIVETLRTKGIATGGQAKAWLDANFPIP
jgi:hypothetical protein